MNERTTMWCDVCRGSDTDPRHHVMMEDGSIQTRHMDCCRDEGCLHCDKTLADSGELRKDDLLRWIEKGMALQEPVVLKRKKR